MKRILCGILTPSFLALLLAGCSTTCRDKYVTEVFTHNQVYSCCGNECVRGEKACGCSSACPCWKSHNAAEAKRRDDAAQGRQEQQRKAQEQAAREQNSAEIQYQFDQGKDHHLHGRYAEAMAIFKKLYFFHSGAKVAGIAAYNVSCEYALMGDKDLALEWLENAFKHGWNNFEYTKQDKELVSIRNESRYKKLVGE